MIKWQLTRGGRRPLLCQHSSIYSWRSCLAELPAEPGRAELSCQPAYMHVKVLQSVAAKVNGLSEGSVWAVLVRGRRARLLWGVYRCRLSTAEHPPREQKGHWDGRPRAGAFSDGA